MASPSHIAPTSQPAAARNSIADRASVDDAKDDKEAGFVDLEPVTSTGVGQQDGKDRRLF
jgi:hypothetical protein